MGDKFFLDHLQAEVIVITNNGFTCRGKIDGSGGSMIDFFVISKILQLLEFVSSDSFKCMKTITSS